MNDEEQFSECSALPPGEDAHRHDEKNRKRRNPPGSSRRSFLGTVGGATAVALTVGIPLEPLLEGKHGQAEASVVSYGSAGRMNGSFQYRQAMAQALQQKQAVENIPALAGAARDLGNAPMGGDSALSRLAGQPASGGR